MAPLTAFIAGYPVVDNNALEQYRKEHHLEGYNLRPFVQHLEAMVGAPLALVRIDELDGESDTNYICYYTDYSGRTHEANDVPPVPAPFRRLPELLPGAVANAPKTIFAHRASVFSYDSDGRSRVNEEGTVIGGEAQ